MDTITLSKIKVDDDNVRTTDLGDVEGLAQSIRTVGLLQPLVLEPIEGSDEYRIVAGHRRHAALKILKTKELTADQFVVRSNDSPTAAKQLVENMQRQDLTPLEQAEGMARLLQDTEVKRNQRDVAELLGVSQSLVSRRIMLLDLPEEGKALLAKGEIDADVAEKLAKVARHDVDLATEVIEVGNFWNLDRLVIKAKANEAARKVADRYLQAGAGVFMTLDDVLDSDLVPDYDTKGPDAPLDVAAWVDEHPDSSVYVAGQVFHDDPVVNVYLLVDRHEAEEADAQADTGKAEPSEAEKKRRAAEREAKARRTEAVQTRMSGPVSQADAMSVGFHALLTRVSPTDLHRVAKVMGLELGEGYQGNGDLGVMFDEAGTGLRSKYLALLALAVDRAPLDEPRITALLFEED